MPAPGTKTFRRILVCLILFAAMLAAAGPGFRSRRQFDEHYAKHGAEFGQGSSKITQQEYLALAQELRDAPASRNILQAVTPDGIISRFDKKNGYFGAFNPDRTIRTFFLPNDGERYFQRQARKRNAD